MINYDMLKVVLGLGNAGGTVINKLNQTVYKTYVIPAHEVNLRSLLEEGKFDFYRDIDVLSNFYSGLMYELVSTCYLSTGSYGAIHKDIGKKDLKRFDKEYCSLGYFINKAATDSKGVLMLSSFKILLEELVGILYNTKEDERLSQVPSFHTLDYHVTKIFNDIRNLENVDGRTDSTNRIFSLDKAKAVKEIYISSGEFTLLLSKFTPEELFKLFLAIKCNILAGVARY